LEEIDHLGHLEDDWNGEGAGPVAPDALFLAKQLVSDIARAVEASSYSWVRPEVAPTPDRGVGLFWDLGDTLAWLIIRPNAATVTCVTRAAADVAPTRRTMSLPFAVRAILLMFQNQ